jgi:hypothetical protein
MTAHLRVGCLHMTARSTQGISRPKATPAMAVRRDLLGPNHPHTLTAIRNLAATLEALDELEGARAIEDDMLATTNADLT